VVQQQAVLDEAVLGLAESLREMVGAANECKEVLVIKGTTNVIEEIGRASLEVASLIHEYSKLPFVGKPRKSLVGPSC